MTTLTWILIVFCISQSAMFSGSNLAFFSITKLRLEVEVNRGNKNAQRVLALRKDPNLLLVTILWGNVAVNVLLALASGSILSGVMAFVFSTVIITLIGEIAPQAYFSRHSLKMASLLSPVVRLYQMLLYPVAKPTALLLDKWLGEEVINYFKEEDMHELIKMHVTSPDTDIDSTEGRGALNFFTIDDLSVKEEGEIIDPRSIVKIKFQGNRPIFPAIKASASDKFLKLINLSGKKWVILVDPLGIPKMVLDSDGFLRDALLNGDNFDPYRHCHVPIIIYDKTTKLGDAIPLLRVNPVHADDDVIDEDIIILWSDQKRIITGSDLLGRLLRNIVQNKII